MQNFPPSINCLISSSFLRFTPGLLILLLCHLLSFLSRQLSLASLLGCHSFPSPVTLKGFNHQLNVTPYLRNPWEHTHSNTHTQVQLPAGRWSYTFSYFIFSFFSCEQLEKHARQDGALPHANCWVLFAYASIRMLILLIKYLINIYLEYTVKMSGRLMWNWIYIFKNKRLAALQLVSVGTDRRHGRERGAQRRRQVESYSHFSEVMLSWSNKKSISNKRLNKIKVCRFDRNN